MYCPQMKKKCIIDTKETFAFYFETLLPKLPTNIIYNVSMIEYT